MSRFILHSMALFLSVALLTENSTMAQDDLQSPPDRMTPELLWKMGRLGSVAISPDGKSVAYAVRRFELAENKGQSTLFILDVASGQSRLVVENWKSIGSVDWIQTPVGERIWFEGTPAAAKADASESAQSQTKPADEADNPATQNQAWFWVPGTAEPVRSTAHKGGISNLKVSPSGDRLAFTARVKLDQNVADVYPDLPKADARIIDSLMYRHWDSWRDYDYSHLFVASINERTGQAQDAEDLMKGSKIDCPVPPMAGSEQFAWSPDGQEIAYTLKIALDGTDWAQSTNSDVYTFHIDGLTPTHNVSDRNLGYDNDPLYSPNGKWMVYNSMQRHGFEADRNRLMLVDRSTGTRRELTAGLDQNANHPVWLPDSSGLMFESETTGTNQIFHIDLVSGTVRQVSSGKYDWSPVGVFPDGKSVLVKQMSMQRPHELVQLPIGGSEDSVQARVLTHINDDLYANLNLPTVEERYVTATDGAKIHCWVIYPPGFDKQSDKQWPMLTYCQGGPQSQISQFFSYRWNFHLMAANDYVVLAVNRRGLPGFGQKWNDDISGDWGGQAMRDLLSATDDLTKENYIDSKRVAAVGASFGGYSVYWLMGNSEDRFCSMISHCGVFNLESMYGTTEELFFVNHDLGGPYWKSPEILSKYKAFSPHNYIGNWKTPLLVIHGEKDFRVPIGQGMEAFNAAQVQGVPSRFLYFPGEGHWVNSPQNSVLWQRVFFEWLDKYCK